MEKSDLHDYQRKALDFVRETNRSALFLEMGLGKTIIALTLIDDLMNDQVIKSALVIAPKKLLKMTWLPEISKWGHLWLQNMTIIEGPLSERKVQVDDGEGLFGVSVDSVMTYHELYTKKWDIVIIDESIKVKNSAARRYLGTKHLTKFRKSRVVIMSGIPAPNSEMDLWSQYFIVDRGERLGNTVGAYRDRFFTYDRYSETYRVNSFSGEKISSLVSDITLAFSAEDYLSMPDKIMTDINVELPDDVIDSYKKMEAKFIYELSKDVIEITSASALLQKTMQVCNGFIYDTLGAERIHDVKLDALQEIVNGDAGENFIVSYQYREDLRALKERFPYAEQVSEENIIKWNNKEIRMLLVHPKSAGYGLNLQDGGSIVVWFSLTWSYSDYEQTNARVYRQGQKKPVRIVRFICNDSVEESIALALERKRGVNRTFMGTLREILVK